MVGRYLDANIREDLKKKMVLLAGPRQSGKTSLGLSLLNPATPENPAYLNWDVPVHRSRIIQNELPLKEPLLVLDEIHKHKNWRNLAKGLYDAGYGKPQVLITGSARLDYYSKGGDSLSGRYFFYRLHPFSLMELNPNPSRNDVEHLLQFGGFPEPVLSGNLRDLKRWQKERYSRVIYDDIRDLENVKEISLMAVTMEALPARVGSVLSVRSLAEDVGIAPVTIDRWIRIFDYLYLTFRIPPYGAPRIRAVKKEQKIYFWDWSQNITPGANFENMVASHLLKYCHFQEDTQGDLMELRYIRDTDKREIDFVVLKNAEPQFAVECKSGDGALSPHIKYFKERTNIPRFYQVHLKEKDFGHEEKSGRVLPFATFCRELGIP